MTTAVVVLALAASASAGAAPCDPVAGAGTLAGVVRDATAAVLPGATITIYPDAGQPPVVVVSDDDGRFCGRVVPPGAVRVEVALPNFATRLFPRLVAAAGELVTLDAVLELQMTADVAVTARQTFRSLAERGSAEGGLLRLANTASEGLVTHRRLERRPTLRVGDVLESVPGLVVSQHSGEGKANQFYLRGFNLDHGTDFATSVAGMPVNLPSHAHGHGYTDVNFVIPELVSAIQFQKGPYAADSGDFAAAGSSQVRYVTSLDRPMARLSAGGHAWRRFFAAASPQVGGGRLLVAAEAGRHDGPWRVPDNFDRFNALVGFSAGDVRNGVSVRLMSYRGTWQATDQAPARAVEAGTLDRFDGVDATAGGDTARHSVSADWQQTRGQRVTRASGYLLRYRLNLFSNFTYFLDNPERGDQFEQVDRRWVGGGRVTDRRLGSWAGRAVEFVAGAEVRRDAIGEVSLHRTVARRRHTTVRSDEVTQSSAAGFASADVQWTGWARSNLGLRADRYWFEVVSGNPLNSGSSSAGVVSPKASLVFGPWRRTEFYISAATGFHSNDARGTTMTVHPESGEPVERVTPLVRARGAELGLRATPRDGLHATVTAWALALDSELLFIGDAGTTDAGRASRRFGLETTMEYSPVTWVTIDADVSLSRARFRDDDPAGSRIPGAVERVIASGITVAGATRFGGSLRVRHLGPRDLAEDGSVRSPATTLVNGQLAMRVGGSARIVLDLFNVLDARVSDIDYFYVSRLPGEPPDGVADRHSHPALPRSARVSVQLGF